ncbi:DNA repair protein [Wickerhamomyces ciferrii]|uniref:DNA repair protein n=1 Tax=Wickerhamomyces ciferrii (strain ATCC 14091 / BCRC 22168 / CBS 111 / JCM 3599 / NBRC 0793 / NRRL Y-1031 F-60-10) TaxID=1206466 RepID=K0KF45_WICCF|nr:DNA repair protein [Wickerhamomyces ciferrii]CCH40837.1 DNA repair protein [Wickerhamomyces ciferrii]
MVSKLPCDLVSTKSIPPEIEDEILEAFTTYSLEDDMKVKDLPSFYRDLKIPKKFIIGNKRIEPNQLSIEGTDIIDFDKLLHRSYQLILFRDHKDIILENWNLLQKNSDMKTSLDFKDIKELSDDVKTGINDSLLLDMVAIATEGQSVHVNFIDFCYTIGKLGELNY